MFKGPECGKRINLGKAHIVMKYEEMDYFLYRPRRWAELEREPHAHARRELGERARTIVRQPRREHRPA